jgi:hypothetical protein
LFRNAGCEGVEDAIEEDDVGLVFRDGGVRETVGSIEAIDPDGVTGFYYIKGMAVIPGTLQVSTVIASGVGDKAECFEDRFFGFAVVGRDVDGAVARAALGVGELWCEEEDGEGGEPER